MSCRQREAWESENTKPGPPATLSTPSPSLPEGPASAASDDSSPSTPSLRAGAARTWNALSRLANGFDASDLSDREGKPCYPPLGDAGLTESDKEQVPTK